MRAKLIGSLGGSQDCWLAQVHRREPVDVGGSMESHVQDGLSGLTLIVTRTDEGYPCEVLTPAAEASGLALFTSDPFLSPGQLAQVALTFSLDGLSYTCKGLVAGVDGAVEVELE